MKSSVETRPRWISLLLSISWILVWVGGCAMLVWSDPRPRFASVWLVLILLMSVMTGQSGALQRPSRGVLLGFFVVGLLTTVFAITMTLLGEEALKQNLASWMPGLVVCAIGYSLAIASFFVRWKNAPAQVISHHEEKARLN